MSLGLRSSVLSLLAILALVRPGLGAEPRWAPLGPPAAPLAARLLVEPGRGDRAYAFNEAGVWRSRDGGGSWRSIQVGLDRPAEAFAFDPSRPGRLYAAVNEIDGYATVLRSDDFGDHWTAVFRGGDASSSYPQELKVNPHAPDEVYWLGNYQLLRSRDAGRTWECFVVAGDCASPSTQAQVQGLAFAPDRPGTMYVAGYGNGFYTTHDAGRTWTSSSEGSFEAVVATREPRTLYGWSRDPFYRGSILPCFGRSDDEGATWKSILGHTQCGAPAVDPAEPRTVRMVVVDNRVALLWLSKNGGETWTTLGPVPEVGDLYAAPGGGLVLATDHGFFRAASEQGPWRPANRGFAASQVNSLLPTPEAVLAVPATPDFPPRPPAVPLLRTGDRGRSWSGSGVINPVALAANPSDARHLFASAVRYEGRDRVHNRVLESRDGGRNWRGVVDPAADPPAFVTLAVDPFEPRTLFGGTLYEGFFRSEDGGRTWQAANTGIRFDPVHCHHYCIPQRWVRTILADPFKAGRVVILFNFRVYESLDHGLNWTLLRPQAPSAGQVQALAREPGGALVAVGSGVRDGDSSSLGVVYRSTDGGATWSRQGRLPILPTRGAVPYVTGLAATRGGLWVSTYFIGVLRSTDGGRTWKQASEGLPLETVTSLVADPYDTARLYATVPQSGIYTVTAP